jgi:hypothetical protein
MAKVQLSERVASVSQLFAEVVRSPVFQSRKLKGLPVNSPQVRKGNTHSSFSDLSNFQRQVTGFTFASESLPGSSKLH